MKQAKDQEAGVRLTYSYLSLARNFARDFVSPGNFDV